METFINLITLLYSLDQAEAKVLYQSLKCQHSAVYIVNRYSSITALAVEDVLEDVSRGMFTQYGIDINHIRTEMDAQHTLQFLIKSPIRPSVQKMTQYLQLYPFTEALELMAKDTDVEVRKYVATCPCTDRSLCWHILENEVDEEVRDMARLNLEYR